MAELKADALTTAHTAMVTQVRDRVLAYAIALWAATPSLRDTDVERLVERIVPIVQGGQLQVANLTNAYIQTLAVLEGVRAAITAVTPDIIDYRGVPAPEVYRRPAVTAYTALAEGKSFEQARAEGLNRLKSIVGTDIQQARNRQSRAAYANTDFDYTLRVLSGAENCALCVIASTQRYRRAELLPLHPGCDCGQRGVRAGYDPGQVIDDELLELTHTAIAERLDRVDRGGRDLGIGKRDAKGRPLSDFTDLIVTRQHGELGPTLTWRDHKFTSAADIDALH